MSVIRKAQSGFQIIHLIGLMLLGLMLSTFAIDLGYYFAAQNQLQTAADAAALAATKELYHNTSVDPATRMSAARISAEEFTDANQPGMTLAGDDVVFGFIDPSTRTYDADTFLQPSADPNYSGTGGYNAVKVYLRQGDGTSNASLPTIMANMLGVTQMNASAASIALVDQSLGAITNGGLRPIYACEAQVTVAMQDGIVGNNVIRIYGDHLEVDGVGNIPGCPSPGSGNWGFADLRDCSSGTVGASTIAD